MKRTSKKTIPVHVTIPVRLLEDFDETLAYNQSRSKKISEILKAYLKREHIHEIWKLTPVELLEHLVFRCDKDSPEDVLIQSLLQLFSKKS